ncbi:SHOCT domain-containing protein [Lactobacillus bombicola]|uniref:SHOCT domain-containing protein n=1 Tax=Lactobacillus bombicola TaxID=1505723 RepID=UPI0015F798B3|nr:SHOCT domain-containing protein [Lactobacillus bombicola]
MAKKKKILKKQKKPWYRRFWPWVFITIIFILIICVPANIFEKIILLLGVAFIVWQNYKDDKDKVARIAKKNKAQCSLCRQSLKNSENYLLFKDSAYICKDCIAKYNFTKSINKAEIWASKHTINGLKKYINQGKNFDDISLEIDKQKEKEKAKKQAEKEKRKQEQAAIKAESVYYGGYYFDIDKRKIYANTAFHGIEFFVNADEITSYRVAEKGHDENKHHVFTRAAVGAIIAGPAGAVIAGTTGGKINEYIDELGVIINLTDGGNFEVSLLNSKNNKADGFLVKHAYSELNHVIAILDGWKATEKVVEDTKDSTDAPAEIRKYKQLMDDGIITKEEFEAKKKQLLGL